VAKMFHLRLKTVNLLPRPSKVIGWLEDVIANPLEQIWAAITTLMHLRLDDTYYIPGCKRSDVMPMHIVPV
jgi:hypothetical protein